MTEKNKRGPVAIGDRTCNLPEHLLDSIFERLPIRDAIRTSILSKKWRYKWTSMRTVVFNEQISKKLGTYGAFGRHGFIRVVNQVLLLHKGPITKFYLYIPKMSLDSFQEVDLWILLLSTKGLKHLTLVNANQRYQLPSYVFSCLELRELVLSNWVFKPPLQFEGFLHLESLILKNIDFMTNLGGTLINSPQLKKFRIHSCTNVYNLKIKATKLQTLGVVDCPDVMLLELLHSQCLTMVYIVDSLPMKDFVRLERMNLASIFINLPKVRRFAVDGHLLKACIAEEPKWFPQVVASLEYLSLVHFSLGDLDHLHGVLCLLRNSPNLETLHMMHIQAESKFMHNGVETTSNPLESPDCLDQTLKSLRTVKLSPIHGSRAQLLFIKLLLAHSPSLEKFTIQTSGTLNADQRFNIAKDVMRFPRASPKAEIIYLDPKS